MPTRHAKAEAIAASAGRPRSILMFNTRTRDKLAGAVEYHQAMADAHKDSDPTLAATHAETAAQIQDVLNNAPPITAIDAALLRRTIRRRTLH